MLAGLRAVVPSPISCEKPSNLAVKSVSIFLAIASPNNLPISPATFLGAEFLAKSVRVVIIPTSEAVMLTDVGLIAVLLKSVASATADADTVPYTGTSTTFPPPVIA